MLLSGPGCKRDRLLTSPLYTHPNEPTSSKWVPLLKGASTSQWNHGLRASLLIHRTLKDISDTSHKIYVLESVVIWCYRLLQMEGESEAQRGESPLPCSGSPDKVEVEVIGIKVPNTTSHP